MKQFIYTRTEGEKTFTDSFFLNRVIRSREMDDGGRIVLLDDIHERWVDMPVANKKGEIVSSKREKVTVQGEIHLNKEDGDRFLKENA